MKITIHDVDKYYLKNNHAWLACGFHCVKVSSWLYNDDDNDNDDKMKMITIEFEMILIIMTKANMPGSLVGSALASVSKLPVDSIMMVMINMNQYEIN